MRFVLLAGLNWMLAASQFAMYAWYSKWYSLAAALLCTAGALFVHNMHYTSYKAEQEHQRWMERFRRNWP